MVRACTLVDVPDLVEMGHKFYAASGLPGAYSVERAAEFACHVVQEGIALRTDAGMILGVLSPAYCADLLMAVEMAWWSEDGQGRALLRAFEAEAKARGADHVRFSTLPQTGERAGLVLERHGYAPFEFSYGKAI